MKLNATISTPKKKKGPFIQNGKRNSFVQTKQLEKDNFNKKQRHFLTLAFDKSTFEIKREYQKPVDHIARVDDIVVENEFNYFILTVNTNLEAIDDRVDLKAEASEPHLDSMKSDDQAEMQRDDEQQRVDPDELVFETVKEKNENQLEVDSVDEVYQANEEQKLQINDHSKKPGESTADSAVEAVDLSVSPYDASLKPIAEIAAAEKTEGAEQKEENEVAIVDPKAIMAEDQEFKSLSNSLKKNAKKEAEHDRPENKAKEAQESAVSPKNERASKAKAKKVERLGMLPPPKPFNANELKESILHEVTKLLKQKEEEGGRTGDKPKISDSEIKAVKDKNNQTIQQQKTATIGDVEEASKEAPDESSVEERTATAPKTEDYGKRIKINKPEKAVAKPIVEERLSLEKESTKIDDIMAVNEIDEQQLGDSDELSFTDTLKEKKDSQQEAATIKQDYRAIEEKKLDKDKETATYVINERTEQIHDVRKGEFGKVDNVKGSTQKVDEAKRKEIADHIESIYTNSEESVNTKLNALENAVNAEFDDKMTTANTHFKENINEGIDNEFTVEWFSKAWNRSDYNKRVRKVFVVQSEKYKKELSDLLDPLTQKIADTLNAITLEIAAAKSAVEVFVQGLEPSLQAIGVSSAKEVMKKFASLENSIEQKQEALTSSLASKYAAGVSTLEAQFKEVMDSRKSWLDKAYDSVVGVITEILLLLADLKKVLEQAVEYAGQIIKQPKQFFNNLVAGATIGFTNFVKNIKKHLMTGALEWVTGEMSSAGIVLPKEFNFKGILSIILQVLGISVAKVKEIAKKVIGPKYVAMLEKGVDIGKNVGGKILKIFSIIKKEGIIGLWEFIKEEFHNLKEKLIEEARNFIIVKIVQTAVAKLVAMLVPGAGFISAIKSLIDFMRTLFSKARAIVNIIMGIVATFGQILAGNVSKVSTMIEGILAKFLGMAITFLAAILGLGNVGKKMNEIIQKKIKDPITKAITKIMEKLKMVMTKLGVFKLLDKIDEGIKKGKAWVEEKKESVKGKIKSYWTQMKDFIKKKFRKTYKEKDGSEHQLIFNDNLVLERHSVSRDLGNYLLDLHKNTTNISDIAIIEECLTVHEKIVNKIGVLIKRVKIKEKTESGETIEKRIKKKTDVKDEDGRFILTDQYFGKRKGKALADLLSEIAANLRELSPGNDEKPKIIIPKSSKIEYTTYSTGDGQIANASLISLDSDHSGSAASKTSALTDKLKKAVKKITEKDSTKVIRGHLINHELFGTGNDIENLAPIPTQTNNDMLDKFEREAKKLVHTGNVISLEVEYNYHSPNGNNATRIVDAGIPMLPDTVYYTLKKMTYTKEDFSKEAIDDIDNWEGSGRKKSIHINHDDFF